MQQTPNPICLWQQTHFPLTFSRMASATDLPSKKKPTVFYDGLCVMCNGFVTFVYRRDRTGQVCFAPIQGETFEALAAKHPVLKEIDSLVLALPLDDGTERVLTHSDASLRTIQLLGGFWGVIASLALFIPTFLRNFFYRLMAKNRYRLFGQYESCPIPPKPLRDRLLP